MTIKKLLLEALQNAERGRGMSMEWIRDARIAVKAEQVAAERIESYLRGIEERAAEAPVGDETIEAQVLLLFEIRSMLVRPRATTDDPDHVLRAYSTLIRSMVGEEMSLLSDKVTGSDFRTAIAGVVADMRANLPPER